MARVFDIEKYDALIFQSGMKRQDLAEKIGCRPTDLSRYSSGDVTPKEDRIEKIAEALGVNADEFYRDISRQEAEPLVKCVSVLLGENGIVGVILGTRELWSNDSVPTSCSRSRVSSTFPSQVADQVAKYLVMGLECEANCASSPPKSPRPPKDEHKS